MQEQQVLTVVVAVLLAVVALLIGAVLFVVFQSAKQQGKTAAEAIASVRDAFPPATVSLIQMILSAAGTAARSTTNTTDDQAVQGISQLVSSITGYQLVRQPDGTFLLNPPLPANGTAPGGTSMITTSGTVTVNPSPLTNTSTPSDLTG